MSLLADAMVKKERENTEENGIISSLCHTCQMCNYDTGEHSNYLTVSAIRENCKEEKHSRKWHHLPLHHECQMCDYHTRGDYNYLMVSAVKTAAKKKMQQEDGTT